MFLADSQQKDVWAGRVIDYVVERQNEDGGYTFCPGIESNAQDTYYGLAILEMLGTPFPNVERTVGWLRSFIPDSLYSHYYVAKALKLCGREPDKRLREFILSSSAAAGEFKVLDSYPEVASEFLSIFMAVELAEMAGVEIDRRKIAEWLLGFKNTDGGFGAHGHSSLNSTYHAVASLYNLGYQVNSLRETIEYVRACEKPYGGFTVVPTGNEMPYMEHIYYGASALDLLGESLRYPRQTAELVLRCQNANGGFARSEFGISTLEDTFYAVSVLQAISRQW